jgi:hypothetical protein
MPKKITLATVYEKLLQHDVRFDAIDARLDDHSEILNRLQGRVDAIHGLVENLEVRMEGPEQEYIMITAALKRLEQRFDQIEADKLKDRIAALETRVAALESTRN